MDSPILIHTISVELSIFYYSKTCVRWLLSKELKLVFKTNYRLMQVKGEHSARLSTFIKLPFVIKIFVLSIFEWPFYTGFTERSGSVVECLTRDRRAAGSSLTGVIVLWSLSKTHFILA